MLAPALHVNPLLASVLHPCKRERKQWLTEADLLRPTGLCSHTGVCVNCLWWWRLAGSWVTEWGMLTLVGVPPGICGGRGWHVGTVIPPTPPLHMPVNSGASFPRQTILPLGTFHSGPHTPVLFLVSSGSTAVLSPHPFSCSVVSDSLQPHGLQHSRLPCPSQSPRVCSNFCPLSR